MSAGALIRDGFGRVLLIEPTYRDDWLPPGGAVESNESPAQGAAREVHEELGVQLAIGRPLVMQWTPADDQLSFVYDGGVADASMIERFRLEPGLASYRFVDPATVGTLASATTTASFAAALEALTRGTFVEIGG